MNFFDIDSSLGFTFRFFVEPNGLKAITIDNGYTMSLAVIGFFAEATDELPSG